MDVCASSQQAIQHGYAVALRSPNQRFVENLLRIGGWMPIRKTTVRTVESACGARFRQQTLLIAEESLQQLEVPKPGSGAKIPRRYAVASNQIGNLAVSPKQSIN